MDKKKFYHISAVFDTETSNIKKYNENGEIVPNETKAICILYIFNDLRLKDLSKYEPDKDDKVLFYRHESEALEYIDSLVEWGLKADIIPIICAYNLMFDLQTLMYEMNKKYDMKTTAQSSTNVYTLDLMQGDEIVLRFWDTYHLEMRGLSAMGETAGLEKATGEWDYSLVRTSETPLTDEELFYAKRDVQVIPAYLKYLLHANEWLKQVDLGNKVLTKTSLVRQMAQRKIGELKITKRNGKQLTLQRAFESLCKKELAKTYEVYAIRKACFRGGWTFTSGAFASKVIQNVGSLDVTSMHHAFINGRYVPVGFNMRDTVTLQSCIDTVLQTSLEQVLEHYYKPFPCAFHMEIEFTNIRLRKGTCFDEWQIALIPMGKFRTVVALGADYSSDERARYAEELIRRKGYHDKAASPVFAFGKLYSADACTLFLSELELWCIAQVYEWDELKPLQGECTVKWTKPPDYVTLQSNMLFEMKNDAKQINKRYVQGTRYELEIPSTIPEGIAKQLKDGVCDESFFESYYNSTVKGMFNGIYGTMAQDVFKPDYAIENGELYVNRETAVNEENFEAKKPKRCKVLYTYGLRIVGGSRMHLLISMVLLYRRFGESVSIVGGDTDSLKIRCEKDIGNVDLLDALEPLHNAVESAIDYTQTRVRKTFPQIASDLDHIGKFECERCGNSDRYVWHMEGWNKARISIDSDMKPHVTCAGLSRPIGKYHIEDFVTDLLKAGYTPEQILPNILGYNILVKNELCYALEHKVPKCDEIFSGKVTDYLGNEQYLEQYEAIALYETGRNLGDTLKKTNRDNVKYLERNGNDIDTSERWLQIGENGKAQIVKDDVVIMEGI